MADPFAVDVSRAPEVLSADWQPAGYDQIWYRDGTGWCAYHRDAADTDAIEADTPGELAAKIRADWLARQGS